MNYGVFPGRAQSFGGTPKGVFAQAKAGHADASTTERYLYAERTSYRAAAKLVEARSFGA